MLLPKLATARMKLCDDRGKEVGGSTPICKSVIRTAFPYCKHGHEGVGGRPQWETAPPFANE